MNNGELTICSVVYNDKKTLLFDLMIKSVLKHTKWEPKFIICDAGGNDLGKYKQLSNFTVITNNSGSHGSLAHGIGLNKIFPLANTKYTAIIESDCVILNDKWNSIENYKMMAASKVENIYHVCFLIFETKMLLGTDFRPGTDADRKNRSYGIEEDVGWRIKEKISLNEFKLIKFIDCKKGNGKCFDSRFQSDELWLDGIPIVAHFGRGSNLSGKANRKGFMNNKDQLAEWKKIAEKVM